VDIKDIKAIIDLMKKNSITEFELERQDSKIRLKRGLNGGAPIVQYDEPVVAAGTVPVLPPVAVASTLTVAPPVPGTGEVEVKSPMIGTFYRAQTGRGGT
jgi:acetyl-CoA carboxylase biotin carboxyl carrier protein